LCREGFRHRIRGKGPVDLKAHRAKKHESEILSIAKGPVKVAAPTMPIYDAVQMMVKEGFRRLPIANPGTRHLEGIITATDVIDYLGGGKKFEIIQQKYGGNFFKAINEPVKLIMTQKVVSVKATAKIDDAIDKMKKSNLGGLPIVDENDSVKGIITERDITGLFADRISGVHVSQLMSQNVVTALPRTTIFECEKTMATQGFRRLPIVSDGKVLGIITTMDIIRFFGSGEVFKHLRSDTIIQVLNTLALEIATKPVSTIEPEADVGQAAKIMHEKDIGAVPVVKSGKLVGIITERDFFKLIQ
jgi:CBS domain-containing protein